MKGTDKLRAELHASFDRLWHHSTKSERLILGVILMVFGAYLSHVHSLAPDTIWEAFAWAIHGLGLERLISLVD